MPTYDYVCQCGEEKEVHHSMTDDTKIKCIKCKKVMEKAISGGAGVKFVGDGFYQTDYKDKGK